MTKEEINRVKLEMPEWCRGIEDVKTGKADALICVIRAFAPEEADLLYLALQYAHEENVPVHFAPRNSADRMYMLTNETQNKLEKKLAKTGKIRRAN